jgi:hypothetical protein
MLVQYFKYNILRSVPIKDTIDTMIPAPLYTESGEEDQRRTQMWVKMNILHNYTVTTHEEAMTQHPNQWLQTKAKHTQGYNLRFIKDSDLSSTIYSLMDLLEEEPGTHIIVSLEEGRLVARSGEEYHEEDEDVSHHRPNS